MEDITTFPYDSLYNDNSDLLFNAYYNFSYNDSDQSFNSYHNSLYDSFNLMLNFSYDFSDLFLENNEKDNRIQIEKECMVKNHQKENNSNIQIVNKSMIDIIDYQSDHQEENNNEIQMEVEDDSEDYCSKEYDDDSEYEEEEDGLLKLNKGMKFETWELAKSYLDEYAKQNGFCFHKIRRVLDPNDNTIVRR
ncbi:hypothetical protein GLOIN_2v1762042 [Rhizophagus irregularis DAOM 181602=DAOM 197198]|uniref:FAR1 domain-containing protein n=2 Tax=Rhizophagus irregularis TaxID=588596 RepID=A0A2P4QYC6_RHIID|nr:hypothetical protein GLOIN_2v1762042 [Rhizophagus irregularis DAOM 181602=DAOM 197198]POG82649.1 hypothetical protein GLOIN_2v1762042 [Rhizophagus irregularis DAOM 181602=DAOM 197198]|eukprot:XP_025189515.1 hypothetical protein GLOIN_2v1762042 [Rhizophagus irregularis DAOM 181602=DAOM 197198]